MACEDCKNCDKKGLLIFPLRYSAVVSDDPIALEDVAKFPGKLGDGVKDITLTNGRYGVRMVRPGYIYMLTERSKVRSWEGHKVLASGQLYVFDVDSPPTIEPEPLCNRDSTSMHGYMLAIRNAHKVEHAWLLFSPTALTKAKLDEYRSNADTYTEQGKLQYFSPSKWVDGSATEQAHSMLADQLYQYVVEYELYHMAGAARESDLGIAMQSQLFPSIDAAYQGTPPNDKGEHPGLLGDIHLTLRRNGGVGFVLHDAIGITQELNDFRNAALDEIRPWLQKRDTKHRATHERMLHIAGAITDVKTGFIDARTMARREKLEQHFDDTNFINDHRRNHAKLLRETGRIEEAEMIEREIARSEAARNERLAKSLENARKNAPGDWEKYEERLAGIESFQSKFAEQIHNAEVDLTPRIDDHLSWLASEALINALHRFDQSHVHSGQQFQDEVGLAVHGMNYTDEGWQIVLNWMKDIGIKPNNLLLRGICSNQENIMSEVRAAFAAAKKAASEETGDILAVLDVIQKSFADATNAFEKSNAAMEAYEAAFKTNYPGMGLACYSMLGQGIFKVGLAGGSSWLGRLHIGLVASSIGKLNAQITISDLAHKKEFKQKNIIAQNESNVRKAIKNEIELGSSGDIYKLRVAGIVSLIEAWGLYIKAREYDGSTKMHLELIAGSMTLAAAGFEGFALGMEYVQKHYSAVSAASRGAAVGLGGIKLFAGTAATFAAGIGAYFDFVDARKAETEKEYLLATALVVRSIAQASISVFGLAVGFAHTAALWEFLATRVQSQLGYATLTKAAGAASWLAAASRLAFALRILAAATWVTLAISVLIWWFSDDALENWCDKSSFRKEPQASDNTYVDEQAELIALYRAFEEVK